jgi:hypothetical protein
MANPSVVPGKSAGELYIPAVGKTIKLVEWREDDFYDSVDVPDGAMAAGATFEFFRDLSNKNLQHTNLRTARRIPAGSEFIMSRIGVLPAQARGNVVADFEDVVKLAYAACLVFKLNDRLISEGPVVKYQSGLGVTGSVATTVAAMTKSMATVGVPSAAAAPSLLVSQPVGDDDDLQATLEFRNNSWLAGGAMPTFAADNVVTLLLHGFIKKPSTR